MEEYVVVLKHITKRFPGVVASEGYVPEHTSRRNSWSDRENGAGKSTFDQSADRGQHPRKKARFTRRTKRAIRSPPDSEKSRCCLAYQELNIVSLAVGHRQYFYRPVD